MRTSKLRCDAAEKWIHAKLFLLNAMTLVIKGSIIFHLVFYKATKSRSLDTGRLLQIERGRKEEGKRLRQDQINYSVKMWLWERL